ncbi:MAG: endonuclease domain-containing protein [Bacillota bacterium]
MLWGLIRDRQLGGAKFRRQHPVGPFILDFYCHEAKLAVELDGGVHTDPEQAKRDAERTKALEAEGIRVLRFWNHEVHERTEEVLAKIREALTPDLNSSAGNLPLSLRERGKG